MTVTTPGSGASMSNGPGFGWRSTRMTGSTNGAGLAIWTDQSHNRFTLRLHGRLCADNVRLLDTHVDLLGGQSCEEVVLDLHDVTVMDQVGARLIVGFGHYVAGRGGRFRLEGAIPAVRALIARAEVDLSA